MKLFFRATGKGYPVLILHGLYGSSDNWVSIARRLGIYYRVILVDQRNHGNSPHAHTHTYTDMANDLFEVVRELGVEQFHLVGHSMGGRVAMQFQTLYPNCVKSMVIVDVSPWSYLGTDSWFRTSFAEHKSIIRGLKGLPLQQIKSRQEADRLLSESISSEKLRQFLFKNLRRNADGGFYWAINLPVLENSLEDILLGVDVDARMVQSLNVLFIKGGNSVYIPKERIPELTELYPRAQAVTIEEAGHWVHAEQPDALVDEILAFFARI